MNRKADDPLEDFRIFLDTQKYRVLLLAESAGRRETLAEYLGEHGLKPVACANFAEFAQSQAAFMLCTGPLSGGFVQPGERSFAIVTENELYAATARPRGRRSDARRASLEGWLRDLSELKIGDLVVHENHGIGRYLGLLHMDFGEGMTEFLHLEYASLAKLYVPVSQLHVISRYSGTDPDSIQLHTLGSGQWEKAKKKAAEQIHDTAAELLNLYALRAAREGHEEEASLTMHDFNDEFLESYCTRAGDALTKAVGAYAIEGAGAWLFSDIQGDHFTILGMPLRPLLAYLHEYHAVKP